MNMRPTFDTAKFQSTLTDGGVPEAQARAQTMALVGAIDESLTDVVRESALDRLESRMMIEFEKIRVEITHTRREFSEKLRVQGWAIIGANAALIAMATALIKLTG